MESLDLHRLQFGFTIVSHYLFPQLTMGLAPIIIGLKVAHLRTGKAVYADAARFWLKLFAINFAFGVTTGLPMEIQFGTNWSRFTALTGGVIGQTLFLEGLFAFFLESSFLFLLLWGEGKLSPKAHLATAFALGIGSWLSGWLIIITHAFMEHPVGYRVAGDGRYQIESLTAYLFNPWGLVELAHNQLAALVTASFVVAAVGAFWRLRGVHDQQAKLNLRLGVGVGIASCLLVAFPTGDAQAKLVATHQPVALAAMEGRFESGPSADLHLLGQPNVKARRLENPVAVPTVLSILAYGHVDAVVKGLDDFPPDLWPTQIELLYYAFHIMAGLGTLFIGLMGLSVLLWVLKRLDSNRALHWALLLAWPFPYIANIAGWMTAELGRQPWLLYGLLRTSAGHSDKVNVGSVLFTLLGFGGLYAMFAVLFVLLVSRVLRTGPTSLEHGHG